RSSKTSISWDELVVRVGSLTSNPSLPLALYTISPLKGSSGCVILPGERVIGAMGCGKWVWVSCECTREVVWARNRGKGGGLRFGGKG
ncbi:hypothetical protein Tco_1286535, partial [Tanacetum coccineum]